MGIINQQPSDDIGAVAQINSLNAIIQRQAEEINDLKKQLHEAKQKLRKKG